MNAAIALAIPVGTLINYANTLVSPIQVAFLGLYDKYAAANDQKAYTLLHYLYCFVITPLPRTVVIFLALWLGVGNLGAINNAMPIWLINGLDVASGMLVAVGFGILTSMRCLQKISGQLFGQFIYIGLSLAVYSTIRKTKNLRKMNDIAILTPSDKESGESLKHRILDRYSNIIRKIDIMAYGSLDLNQEMDSHPSAPAVAFDHA